MTRKHIQIIASLLCPAGSGADAADFFKDLFKTIPFMMAVGLRLLFWVFWWAPLFTIWRLRTVRYLSEVDRERYFAWWEYHRWYFVREGYNSLKVLSLVARIGREWELKR